MTGVVEATNEFVQALINDAPAADVAPVIISKREINCDGYYPYCLHCGKEPEGRVMTDFCPNCGAKMDMESEEKEQNG